MSEIMEIMALQALPEIAQGKCAFLTSQKVLSALNSSQVEQKLVGWLVGGRGKTVQQIQDATVDAWF